jgi:quercetin dioxygenase-like cupin family protein
MKVFRLEYAQHPEQVLSLLELPAEAQASMKMGTARIEKESWVPREGYSRHDQHEVCVILKGELEIESGGQPGRMMAGDVSLIPAGESHRARALEDTELIWFWFGETPGSSA